MEQKTISCGISRRLSDMEEIVDYITLQNPDAAYHFLERVEAAIWKRLEFHYP